MIPDTPPATEAPLPPEVAAVLADPSDEGNRLRFAAWLHTSGRGDPRPPLLLDVPFLSVRHLSLPQAVRRAK